MIGSHLSWERRSTWRAPIALATAILVLTGSSERRVAGQVGTGPIELVSVTTTGVPGGGQLFLETMFYDVGGPSHISGDNRYVVFASPSDQMVMGDTNGRQDIFVRDRQTGTTILVSRTESGGLANDHSGSPVISANGRYVAFVSLATNIVAGDANGASDIFVRDLQTGATALVSTSSSGTRANGLSIDPVINADGRYIAFVSYADNLIAGDTNLFNADIFVRDTVAGTTERVSLRPDGAEIVRSDSLYPSISADGRRVAFGVYDNALGGPPPASAGPNIHHGVYVRDLNAGSTTLVSVRPDGSPADRLYGLHPMISANGRYVTFTHWEDLDPNFPDELDENDGPFRDVFVRDLQTGITDRVSLPFPGGPVEESGGISTISANGRYVAYLSNTDSVRIRDRVTGTTTVVGAPGVTPDGYLESPSISEDGQLVSFESYATNFAPNDTNGVIDTFVFHLAPSADLSLTLTSSTLQPPVNGNLTLTVGITNGGPSEATGVAVRTLLPAGLTFVSATPSAGSYASAAGIWTVGTVATGATSTLQIVAQFTATSSVPITAQVSASSLPDPDSTPDNSVATEDDQRTIVLTPRIADLSLTLSANTASPTVNSNVTLTAALTNGGPGTGTGVAVHVALPASLTFVSSTPGAGAYNSSTGTWTLPSLANGTTQTLDVVARVTTTTELDVVAQLSAANETDPDSTPNNNVATEDDHAAVRLTPAASTGIIVNDATPAMNPTDGKCTLIEAIIAANTDTPSGNALGECAGGNGPDVIHLRALTPQYTFVAVHDAAVYGPNALPLITSDITIDGAGATIERSPLIGIPAFRLFAVETTGRLVLDRTVVRNGRAQTAGTGAFGGGIINNGMLELSASVVSDNVATCFGGGISSAGRLVLRGGTIIQNNSTGCNGGGVGTFNAGSVTVDNTTFQFNSAPTGSGGAFYAQGTTTATMTASRVLNNTALLEGGGIFMYGPDANLSVANTTIAGNVVTAGSGGGIANGKLNMPGGSPLVLGGTMTLVNVSVVANRATGGYGGGISTTSPLTITASGITDNQVTGVAGSGCGGGLYNAAVSTVAGTTIARNQAPAASGGGICSIGLGALTVTGSTIASNSTFGLGGGVALFFSPAATFTDTTIASNTSSGSGGGIYSLVSDARQGVVLDNTLVQQNSTLGGGGGLSVASGTVTLRNNTRILSNVAATAGGGILLRNSGACCPMIFVMTGGVIDGNTANGDYATYGGGGGLANDDTHATNSVTLTDVVISSNRAPMGGNGGGIFTRGRLTMSGGALLGNDAQAGGGLANGTSVMTGGSTALINVLIEGNVASVWGGGIFSASASGGPLSTTVVSGGAIRNNRASDGGGIYVWLNSVLDVLSAALRDNVTTGAGGGIYSLSTLRVVTSTLSGNSADTGGAIRSAGRTVVTGSTLNGNGARVGAGVTISGNTTDIVNSTISGNTATNDGAGAVQLTGTSGAGGPSTRVNLVHNTITNNVGSPGGVGNQAGYGFVAANILAANRRPDGTFSECSGAGGALWQYGHNLIGQDPACTMSAAMLQYPIDPATVFTTELGPLADNGGPTQTHALLPGSFAINAVPVFPPGNLAACPDTDQRGLPRPVDGGDGVTRCDVGSVEYQELSPTSAPTLTSASIARLLAGPAPVIFGVNGTGFRPFSTARWNGAPRVTTVTSANQLQITLLAGDLTSATDLATAVVTVENPDGQVSNALAMPIVSSRVGAVQSRIVTPGNSTTVSTAPSTAGQSGVSATLTNNNPSSTPATVTVANYSSSPVGGTIFAAGGFFDLQVTGADPSDSVAARFYYQSTILAGVEAGLVLRYWNGTALVPVIGSGGAAPIKDTTNNLDGTVSGGRFSVTFDATSTPSIMDLSGTVFAIVEDTTDGPPVTVATESPGVNAAGWHNTSVFVTLMATAPGSTIARTEYNLDDRGWATYTMPIPVLTSGIHTLRYRSITSSGAVEDTKTLTVRIDKTAPTLKLRVEPLILWPADGRLRNIEVDATLKDSLSGGDRFTLISVDSNHRDDAGDMVGWTLGTPDTRGQLRAEFTGLWNPRIYRLTYKGIDRAGNEAIEYVYVLVLQIFGHP